MTKKSNSHQHQFGCRYYQQTYLWYNRTKSCFTWAAIIWTIKLHLRPLRSVKSTSNRCGVIVDIVNTPQKSCTDIYLRQPCNVDARRPMVFVGFVRTNCEEFKCVIAACFCWLCNVCSGCGQEFRCFVLFAVFQLLTESPCFHAPIWMQFLSLSRNLRSTINPAQIR